MKEPISPSQLRQAVADYRSANNGAFPTGSSGEIPGLGLTWASIDRHLNDGGRGLPAYSSLARWLDKEYPDERVVPPFTDKNLLAWVKAHREAHGGKFPNAESGEIPGANTTWGNVQEAFRFGRGVKRLGSLANWLDERFPEERGCSRICAISTPWLKSAVDRFRVWHQGDFPSRGAGRVAGSSVTWTQIDNALLQGGRSLAKWIERHYPDEVRITDARVRHWIDRFRKDNAGEFPTGKSGLITGATKTWLQVDSLFRKGEVEGAATSSLSQWMDSAYPEERRLSSEFVARCVADYFAAHRAFPSKDMQEPVAPGSRWSWAKIDTAMATETFGWQGKTRLQQWIEQHADLLVDGYGQAEEESQSSCASPIA